MIKAKPKGEGVPYPVEPPFTYLPELGEGNVTFTVSPVELDAIDRIEPLGRMNTPSEHIIPTEHGGFILKNPSMKYQLRAPADGIIFEIIHLIGERAHIWFMVMHRTRLILTFHQGR